MVFVDCGFHIGVALKGYIDRGVVDDSWKIYAFEANPKISTKWFRDQTGFNLRVQRKAVWTKDTTLTFNVHDRDNASSIRAVTGQQHNEITVSAFDFSAFLKKLPRVDICSMDIEGAEFPVLEKMLKEDTIDKIGLLDVEFHHRFLADKNEDSARDLIERILARGVAIKLKVPII